MLGYCGRSWSIIFERPLRITRYCKKEAASINTGYHPVSHSLECYDNAILMCIDFKAVDGEASEVGIICVDTRDCEERNFENHMRKTHNGGSFPVTHSPECYGDAILMCIDFKAVDGDASEVGIISVDTEIAKI